MTYKQALLVRYVVIAGVLAVALPLSVPGLVFILVRDRVRR